MDNVLLTQKRKKELEVAANTVMQQKATLVIRVRMIERFKYRVIVSARDDDGLDKSLCHFGDWELANDAKVMVRKAYEWVREHYPRLHVHTPHEIDDSEMKVEREV